MNNIDSHAQSKVDILVVEDSDTQAEQLADLLTSHGYSVALASNGRQGLEKTKELHPLLVISDISMPEMDGFTMCRELKQHPVLREIPVILLTSLTSLYDVIKGLDCGADNFLRKPFDGKYLMSRIRFILINRSLRKDGKVDLGMQINLGGQLHFVNAERQQIFDLLISTYEEAIHMTEELRAQQNQITHSYQSLQGLYKIAEALNPAITEKAVAEHALQQVLELPGVAGGCIMLLDDSGKLHITAAEQYGQSQLKGGDCTDCRCARRLAAGEMTKPELMAGCALLAPSVNDSGNVCIGIPLVVGDRTLGIMNLQGTGDETFQEQDLQVLGTVGHQIAVALERAKLYVGMESLVRQRTEALEAERNLLSDVIRNAGAMVILTDPDGRILSFNPAAERSLGWKFEEVKGKFPWDVFGKAEERESNRQLFEQFKEIGETPQTHQEWIARDGSIRHIIWSMAPIRNQDKSIRMVLGSAIDVTELRQAEERVQYLSNFDSVTSLPNRILLRDRTEVLKETLKQGRGILGMLMIHFSRLAKIRETFGVNAEQELLKQAAKRVQQWTHGDDMVGRFGDASFAVAVVRQEAKDMASVARSILTMLNQPFMIGEQEIRMEATIGIALYPADSEEYDTLCQHAEAAMWRAQERGAERYEFYRPDLNRGMHDRFRIESELHRALEREQLLIHYQPQLDLRTGKVIGLEVLLRWQHPELGMVSPAKFIPIAEETGMILPIGEWVLREACKQVCSWQRMGVPVVPIAVNLSAKQFSSDIARLVRDTLKSTGLDAAMLELELTESLSMQNPENTISILRTLKDMGVHLSIDDFGTGYSNLNYLKRFPVDKLKLDQSFVRDLVSDPDDLSISRAVVSMAKSLRLKVIAEGVETQGQLALLAYSGCDEMQGYLFSRPVDALAAEKLLREGSSIAPSQLKRRPYQRTLLMVEGKIKRSAALADMARARGYHLHAAASISEAFEILATNEVGVVVCDQDIGGMPAVQFLSRVANMYPDTMRILAADLGGAHETAGQEHAALYRMLSRTCKDSELAGAIEGAFRQYELGTRAYVRAATG